MKNIFKTALIIFFFSALSSEACAAVLDSTFLKEKIKKDVENQIHSLQPDKKIKVEITDLPYDKIETHEGKNGKVEIDSKINPKFFNPVTLVRVNVLVNGELYRSFVAPVKISIYDKVWVAIDYIKRGDVLTNVSLEEKDVTYLNKPITEKNFNPNKYLSERNYNPGDVINSDFLETVPDVVKDSPVSVIFQTPSVSVTIPGVALDKGSIGDFIKVRSKNYKKDYLGKVISENLVLVNI